MYILEGEIMKVEGLTEKQKERMFELLALNFNNVKHSTFLRDLSEKEWVILLKDKKNNTIQGFSTMMLLNENIEGLNISALFSGDTILSRKYWGEVELARTWGRFALSLIDKFQGAKLYWFLISKGFRTYHFLPLYFKEYYPRYDKPTPPLEKKILDALATRKFQDNYNPATGVIHFKEPKDSLKAELLDVNCRKLKNPHFKFFVERNPGYVIGDELACLAEISRENFKPAAFRVINWSNAK